MARITPLAAADAGWLVRLAYRFARRRYGAVPEPASVMAHHPKLLRAWALFEMRCEKAYAIVPDRIRDLAVHRVATKVGCSWCVDFGTMLSLRKGQTLERLRAIDHWQDAACFDATERLVLAYADAITDDAASVSDAQVRALEERLGKAGLVELTFAIAHENMRARFNHALGIADQGFTSGDACRLPEAATRAALLPR